MKVSIIIPSFNEGTTLFEVVKKVLLMQIPGYYKEVIVVDNGSKDNTPQVFKKLSRNRKIKLIVNNNNLGKGASILKALKIAKGDIVVIQDADLEYDPVDIPKLIAQFKDKHTNVVFGSRVLGNNPISHWTFNYGGRFITMMTNLLYGTKITDEPTGYKVFRSSVLKNLNLRSRGFEFCPEVTAKIAKAGIKIAEVPISYKPRSVSEKKIKWYDGFTAIYYLIKYRFLN